MSQGVIQRRGEPWRPRLYLPSYGVAESARYARTSPQAVGHWHFGRNSLGPVMAGRERGNPLSYLELVEVAFVSTFRRLGIPLQRIRRTRAYAAQVLHAEYPFAELGWKTDGMHLLLNLHEVDPSEAPDLGEVIFADSDGQTAWGRMISDRFMEFEYVGDLALIWHVRGTGNPIVIDPRVAFGAPMVKGVATWVIKGRFDAGEEPEEIAADFGLDLDLVMSSLQFEGVPIGQGVA